MRGVKAKLGYWDTTHFSSEFGILAHRNRDIGIPVTDLGYAYLFSGYLNWNLEKVFHEGKLCS